MPDRTATLRKAKDPPAIQPYTKTQLRGVRSLFFPAKADAPNAPVIARLLATLDQAIAENEEWSQSFALYDRSLRKAQALWQKETGNPHLFPGNDKLINWFIAERERLTEERDEARVWAEKTVRDVASRRTVTCVYCGHEYTDGTATSQDERLTSHIRKCEKHPMRALETENASLREGIASQAQKVHQAYHVAYGGTWMDCPKDVCASARTFLSPA